MNGVSGHHFAHRRGLRQGNPLSPFLFILAIEPLHHLLAKAVEQKFLQQIPGRELKLRVSLYADDAVVFTNPTRQEVDSLLGILRQFRRATGLCINTEKSTGSPVSCNDIDLAHVLHNFGGSIAPFPIKYLGLPLITGRLSARASAVHHR